MLLYLPLFSRSSALQEVQTVLALKKIDMAYLQQPK